MAGILWHQQVQTFHCTSNDKSIHAIFGFENDGPNSIALTEIKPSCGCTLAEAAQQVYKPGETGNIDVTYTIGEQTGQQVKTIAVRTDEPGKPIYVLSLIAYLPEPLRITPRYIYWAEGREAVPQTIRLTASAALPVKVWSVVSNNPAIKASLEVQQNGEAYSIVVIPANTKAPIRGMLTIVTDLQLDGKNRKFFAYAEVRPIGNPQTTSRTSNF